MKVNYVSSASPYASIAKRTISLVEGNLNASSYYVISPTWNHRYERCCCKNVRIIDVIEDRSNAYSVVNGDRRDFGDLLLTRFSAPANSMTTLSLSTYHGSNRYQT